MAALQIYLLVRFSNHFTYTIKASSLVIKTRKKLFFEGLEIVDIFGLESVTKKQKSPDESYNLYYNKIETFEPDTTVYTT